MHHRRTDSVNTIAEYAMVMVASTNRFGGQIAHSAANIPRCPTSRHGRIGTRLQSHGNRVTRPGLRVGFGIIVVMAMAGSVIACASSRKEPGSKRYTIYLSNNFVGNDWRQQYCAPQK